ncbi:MAG: hypothetical protein ACO2ZL_06210 [Flavobacteriales bacterium]
MKAIRWILTYVAAIAGGSIAMMALHALSGILIPEAAMDLLPQGDAEAMKLHIAHLPFSAKASVLLSHWLGTALGAAIAAALAPVGATWQSKPSRILVTLPGWVMGVWFLMGGIANAAMIPMPTWMVVADLVGYIPIAFVAAHLVFRLRP